MNDLKIILIPLAETKVEQKTTALKQREFLVGRPGGSEVRRGRWGRGEE